jgi:hypothetical protein
VAISRDIRQLLDLSLNCDADNCRLVNHVLRCVEGSSNVFLAYGRHGRSGNVHAYNSNLTSDEQHILAVLLQLSN